tara:strand:- start:655 stop:1326 length:672 start_codon:yes stop_codon:yes gene_type:complete
MSLKNYIQNKKSDNFTYKGIEVIIKDKIEQDVSIEKVLKIVTSKIPNHLTSNFKRLYIGDFENMREREIQAFYSNKSIYITNRLKNDEDLLDDLIHEISHSIEEKYSKIIYGDKKIEEEFLTKRKQMWSELKNNSIELPLGYFLNPKYDLEFDTILYKEIGYDLLSAVTSNIFYSPYAATSIGEYFANGFEAFFMNQEVARLKNISPQLFKKIIQLLEADKNE